jgi:hypothetical protein
MFRWYEGAAVCYAYLAKQIRADSESPMGLTKQLQNCRWFSRGWTLQELLAPRDVVFYDHQWNTIGNKFDLSSVLSDVTGINQGYIETTLPLSEAIIAEKMCWASERETTREEDKAYCLLGLFGVNMPLLYGEGGSKAFLRLQEEILKKSYDATIFGRKLYKDNIGTKLAEPPPLETRYSTSLLASSSYEFLFGKQLEINPDWPPETEYVESFQNGTVRITVPIIEPGSSGVTDKDLLKKPIVLALFGFRIKKWGCDTIGLVLRRLGENLYCACGIFKPIAVRIPVPSSSYLRSHTKTIYVRQKPQPNIPAGEQQLVDLKLIRQFPGGFRLQTFITVPPIKYDPSIGRLYNFSVQLGPICAFVYSHPFGNRFALLYNMEIFRDIKIRLITLGRVDTVDPVHTPPDDRGGGFRFLQVPIYKWNNHFLDLGASQEQLNKQCIGLYSRPVLQIGENTKVQLGPNTIHSEDKFSSHFLDITVVSTDAKPHWTIPGI